MMNDLDSKIEVTPDDWKKITNRGMWMVFALVFGTVLLMTTCTMHSNTYDPARLREEAAIRQVEAEIERTRVEVERQQLAIQTERLKTLERLVKLGVNPVAARCGIMGGSLKNNTACIVAAGQQNPITKQTEE